MTTLVQRLRGMALPARATMKDLITSKDYIRVIDTNVRMIVMTRPGEYVMHPDFGCLIWMRVFDMADTLIGALIDNDIKTAVNSWEPRVTINRTLSTPKGNTVNVQVYYEISAIKIGEVLKIEFNIGRGA